MERNEFEKNISQKLDGFNLIPSEESWAQIEKRIQHERRRRFIFWTSTAATVLFIVVTASILFIRNDLKEQQISKNAISHKKGVEVVTATERLGSNQITALTETKSGKKNTLSAKTNSKSRFPEAIIPQKKITTSTTNTNTSTQANISTIIKEDRKKLANSSNTSPGFTNTDTLSKTITAETIAGINQPATKDTSISFIETIQTDEPTNKAKPDSVSSNKQIARKKQTWKLHLTGGIGISSVGNYFEKSSTLNQRQFAAFAPGTTGNLSSAAVLLEEASHSRKTSFQIGIQFRKELKKSNFSFGFTYLNAGSKMIVGSYMDSVAFSLTDFPGIFNGYTNNSSTVFNQNYSNQLHFFKLDMGYGVKIFKQLSWQTNAGVAFVYAERYLNYAKSINIYVQNKSLIRQTNFFFSTGPEFAIGKKQQILFSPKVDYFILPVQKSITGSYRKLMNLSFNLSVPIKK